MRFLFKQFQLLLRFEIQTLFFPLEAYRLKLYQSLLVATFSPSRMWKCYHLDAGVSCNLLSVSYQILQTSLKKELVLLIGVVGHPFYLDQKSFHESFQISSARTPRANFDEIAALIDFRVG